MNMNYVQLKFPPYEWLKKLPLTEKYTYKDRFTGEEYEEDTFKEYEFTLFATPTDVYGRFTYNEDDSHMIYFDVMEDGYCDHNNLGKRFKFTKKDYQAACEYAQKVYEDFQRYLFADQSWQWAVTPEEYYEQHTN